MASTTESLRETGTEDINIWTGFRLLLPFAKYVQVGFATAAVLAGLSSLTLLGPFWLIYLAVDDIVTGEATRGAMYRYAAFAVGFIVLQYSQAAAAEWTSHRGAFATLEQIRLRIGRRLGQIPLGFVTNRRSGEIQRTLSDDIERLELFLAHAVPDVVSAFTAIVFTVTWLFIVDWRMALCSLIVVAISLPIMALGAGRGSGKLGEYSRSMARMNALIVEFVRAMPVVRTFNGTGRVFGETKTAIEHAAEYESEWGREFLPMFTVFYVLVTSPILTILPLGLLFWHFEMVSTSTLLFFFIVGLGFTLPLVRLLNLMTQLAYLGLGARLVRQLDEATVLPEPVERADLAGGRVEVSEVSFAYPESPRVLDDVSFTADPGTVTAIAGPSGAGKSTLARLIVRFWDVDGGAIRIGGVDVREMPMAQLMG
ncbi:MAG: ABC transporter ATP-binding protein [Dehalococcoidia bacterium]|nr:ABC transporter ATP-binding protein [Dehalococcoidia bacterium]